MRFDRERTSGVIQRALRTSSALGYGCSTFPYSSRSNWGKFRASRAPKLKEWLLDKESLATTFADEYTALSTGTIRVIVAGTGAGKSTLIPYTACSKFLVNGIVLQPDDTQSPLVVPYMDEYCRNKGGVVNVAMLSSIHSSRPLSTPALYYSKAVDFLAKIAAEPNLLSILGIDFILMDECHSLRPEYDFMKYMRSHPLFSSVKLFYATATSSPDVSMERGDKAIVACPQALFTLESPESTPRNSPLHYSNIEGRTIVFFSTDQEKEMWEGYYVTHDVPVYATYYRDSLSKLPEVPTFLQSHELCVLLTDARFQTGVTLNVDTVICTGYVVEYKYDFVAKTVGRYRRPVTSAERTQRLGRVDRFKKGRGFYNDVETYYPTQEYENERAFYIYLWSQLMNVEINEPVIAGCAAICGEVSQRSAALLLHSRVPPYCLVPYITADGFYSGWADVMRYTNYRHINISAVSSNEHLVPAWKEYNYGPDDVVSQSVSYRMDVEFPRDLRLIPAYAWLVYSKTVNQDTISVSGFTTYTRLRANTEEQAPGESTTAVDDDVFSDTTSMTRPVTGRTHMRSVSMPERVVSTATRSVNLADINSMIMPIRQQAESIRQWNNDTSVAQSVHRIGSDHSDDKDNIALRQVDPVAYKNYKLYPMDPSIFVEYINNPAVDHIDRKRVNALITGKRNFTALRSGTQELREKQIEYFLATLRVHNSATVMKLQLSSGVKTSIFDRAHVLLNGDKNVYTVRILETARLLNAFTQEGYYVGIDKRSLQSLSSIAMTPDYSQEELLARCFVDMGDPAIKTIIARYETLHCPKLRNGECIANAWYVNGYRVSVLHAFEQDINTQQISNEYVHKIDTALDLVVFNDNAFYEYETIIGIGKNNEDVVILRYNDIDSKVQLLGPYTLHVYDDDMLLVNKVLDEGCSGALVVSYSTGSIVGLYVGLFSGEYARVTPLHNAF